MIPRRVHTVHLNAPSETLLRRGSVLLEDAMHTASLPVAESGRLWLVRSINLGNINPKNSAASIALTLEDQFRHLKMSAVHGSNSASDLATVVYFHDLVDAYCCFVLRLMEPVPIQEWFWRSALPKVFQQWQSIGQSVGQSRSIALKLALSHLLDTPAQVLALAELLHRLQQANRLDNLLKILDPTDGEVLLEACGWRRSVPNATSNQSQIPLSTTIAISPSAIAIKTLLPWFTTWRINDARSQWLAAIWVLMDQPYLRSDTQLIQRIIPWIQQITRSNRQEVEPIVETERVDQTGLEQNTLAIAPPAPNSGGAGNLVSKIGVTNTTQSPQNWGFGGEPTGNVAQNSSDREVEHIPIVSPLDARDSIPLDVNPESIASPSIEPELNSFSFVQTDRSSYAGFFSVIPLLNQLGFFHRCDQLSPDFPAHLLSQVAIQFGIPEGDPIRQALTDQSTNSFFGHIDPLAEITPDIMAWISAMRFWCRRYVGMNLTEIIDRPGAFTLTRTHLDIFFHHDQADIRIRRSGLDLDPGWVPWLGRVVLFHYGNGA